MSGDETPPTQPRPPGGARGVAFVTYNGLLDPLGPSQILPYLERLCDRWPVHILSFERPDRLVDAEAVAKMTERLERSDIRWTRLRYHKWPSLLASTWDLLVGVVALRRILRGQEIGLVHARGYLPATIAIHASSRHPVLFDIRGLQPEEYVDGGVWRQGEIKHRLAKRAEKRLFRAASGAVVLTRAIRPYVEGRFAESRRAPPIEVIPCCVDLERFRFDPAARARRRAELKLAPDTTVFVYSGSLGTWYMPAEMASLVAAYRETTGRRVFLLWMVNNEAASATRISVAAGLSNAEHRVLNASADDVPEYLSAADVALALVRPSFSKTSSSPTKYAECLAMGLPLVISHGVGDGDEIEQKGGAIALDPSSSSDALSSAASKIAAMLERPREDFRRIATELFDIDAVALPFYRSLYERLIRG